MKHTTASYRIFRHSMPNLFIRSGAMALLCGPLCCVADQLFFQPSEVASSFSSKTSHQFVYSLSNELLAEQAQLMLSTEMSAHQRALNHRWLAVQSGNATHVEGSKIFSLIAKKTFKQYWKNKRKDLGTIGLITNDSGDIATQVNDVDYNFRLSSDGIKFKLDYEFN